MDRNTVRNMSYVSLYSSRKLCTHSRNHTWNKSQCNYTHWDRSVIPQPIHIKFGLYEFRTLPQGLWERFEKEIKHFQGPKDIVLFNCVFWNNTTSFTGWKVGVLRDGHLECCDPITSPHQERWGLIIPSPTRRNKSFLSEQTLVLSFWPDEGRTTAQPRWDSCE